MSAKSIRICNKSDYTNDKSAYRICNEDDYYEESPRYCEPQIQVKPVQKENATSPGNVTRTCLKKDLRIGAGRTWWVELDSEAQPNLATYRCHPYHHHVTGNLQRFCQNGTWNGTEPFCEPNIPKGQQLLYIVVPIVVLFTVWLVNDFVIWRDRKRTIRHPKELQNKISKEKETDTCKYLKSFHLGITREEVTQHFWRTNTDFPPFDDSVDEEVMDELLGGQEGREAREAKIASERSSPQEVRSVLSLHANRRVGVIPSPEELSHRVNGRSTFATPEMVESRERSRQKMRQVRSRAQSCWAPGSQLSQSISELDFDVDKESLKALARRRRRLDS